jgi:hypothetical protein
MTAYSRHGRLLEERIEERITDLSNQLGYGSAVDYPNYRQSVGQIQGLRDALKISEDADRELNGG